MSPTRVLVVDDAGIVRAGLHLLLESIPNVSVIGEAGDGKEAIDQMQRLHPDIVLMDVSMPGLNGIEATRRAAELRPRPRVVVLSMYLDKAYLRHALAAGAAGYLVKSANSDELTEALEAVSRGETWISPAFGQAIIDDVRRGLRSVRRKPFPLDVLTPRQREVLQLIAEGNSTRQIARRLRLSIKTVESHRAHIMERLDTHHVAGLVRHAIRAGLVPPAPDQRDLP